MRQLMISLDKNILNPGSAAARRMIEYGEKDELFIIIPDRREKSEFLSETVYAQSSGGWSKKEQFFRLRRLGRSIIKEKNIEIISAQDPFFTGLIGWCLKKKTGKPLEIQVHGDFYSTDYYKKSGFMNWLRYHLGKFVLRRADKIRAVGGRIKASLLKMGVSENKIVVRPVPLNIEAVKNYQPHISLRAKYPGYEKIFLCLGRPDKVKNIPWLIGLFKEPVILKENYLLLIVGQGKKDRSRKLKAISCELRDNVKFEPWTGDPISYIKTADAVLFPSLSEGYGLVAMEAAAAGTPLIMSDVGVANDELKPGDKVIILPVNDKEKWVEAILKI